MAYADIDFSLGNILRISLAPILGCFDYVAYPDRSGT